MTECLDYWPNKIESIALARNKSELVSWAEIAEIENPVGRAVARSSSWNRKSHSDLAETRDCSKLRYTHTHTIWNLPLSHSLKSYFRECSLQERVLFWTLRSPREFVIKSKASTLRQTYGFSAGFFLAVQMWASGRKVPSDEADKRHRTAELPPYSHWSTWNRRRRLWPTIIDKLPYLWTYLWTARKPRGAGTEKVSRLWVERIVDRAARSNREKTENQSIEIK